MWPLKLGLPRDDLYFVCTLVTLLRLVLLLLFFFFILLVASLLILFSIFLIPLRSCPHPSSRYNSLIFILILILQGLSPEDGSSVLPRKRIYPQVHMVRQPR